MSPAAHQFDSSAHLSTASKELAINTRRINRLTPRKGLAAAGVVALVAAGSAACGTAQAGSTPQDKVTGAFTKLGDQKSLTLGASLDASADQIYAVLKADDFTRDDAAALAALHAKLSVAADKPLNQLTSADKGGSFGIQLAQDAAGTQNLAEVRSVDQKLYLRFDLKALQKLAPTTTGANSLADLNQLLDSFGQLPSSAGALKAAVDGKWISIDATTLTSLAQTLGGGTGTGNSGSTGSSGLDAQSERQLLTALQNALTHNAKFTDLGSSGGADHVQVSVPARQFADELRSSLTPVLKNVPGFDTSTLDSLGNVPNRTVTADVAIKSGAVSGVTFDLAQLDDQPHTGKVPLSLTLQGGGAPVTAPSGAQRFDPQDLLGLILPGGITGTDTTGNGSTGTGSWFSYSPL